MSGTIARKIAGFAALIALCAIALTLRSGTGLELPAEIRAARDFTISSIDPGRYLWSLRDGSAPLGDGLIEERMLVFDRADLIEIRLDPAVHTGAVVEAGQRVASLHSNRNAQTLQELAALRESLVSRRNLISAGGAHEEVAAAHERVRLAQASLEAQQARLTRLRALAAQELISEAELEVAVGEHLVRQRNIDVAKAEVGVAEAPARPQMLNQIDNEIAAFDASIAEIESLRAEEIITSPINGAAEVGGTDRELRIVDLETVYARVAVPEQQRPDLQVGSALRFSSQALADQTFVATVVAIAETSTCIGGIQLFWMTAEIEGAGGRLRPGMTGTMRDGNGGGWWPKVGDR